MERTFTADETIVLNHFFTNTTDSVYCATDAMPTSLWAFLTGGYSRSQLSMRERFLAIFEEMQNECDAGRLPADQVISIPALARCIAANEISLNSALASASNFMSKWGVTFGHNSLKDGCTDRFAVEGLSQRATKILESMKLAAYQEKSTRYLDFSQDTLYLPKVLLDTEFGEEAQIVSDSMMSDYNSVLSHLITYYKQVTSRSEFKTDGAWERTAKAKAFDSARYLLPLSVRTSVGVTLPSRETERLISTLLASRHEELREIGEKMRTEAIKINPGLIKHVKENRYLERNRNRALEMFAETIDMESDAVAFDGFGAHLMWSTPELNLLALASLVQASEGSQYNTATIMRGLSKQTPGFRESVADSAMRGRGEHDEWPLELAVGQLGFDIIMDFGAYRDLQRHRVGMQQRVKPTTRFGYMIPEVLEQPELAVTKRVYTEAMDRLTELNQRVAAVHPWAAEYLTALGHKCRFTYACDLRQWAYLVELRSGPSCHFSYRQIAHQMARAVLPLIPDLAQYVRVNWEGEVDRREAEERTQAKLAALQAQTH